MGLRGLNTGLKTGGQEELKIKGTVYSIFGKLTYIYLHKYYNLMYYLMLFKRFIFWTEFIT